MRCTSAWLASLLVLSTFACGGAQVDPDGGADAIADAKVDGASDASSDAPSDASSCVASPKAGTPCTPGQVTCDHVNACCVPTLGCNPTSKTWELLALGCLCPTYPCGPKTCAGTEMCIERASGVDGGSSSYECAPYPDACKTNWTCGCVQKSPPASCLQPGCSDTPFPVRINCAGI